MADPQSFLAGKVLLYPGDCMDVLAEMPENSIDAVVTDPPYHLTSIVKRFGDISQKDVTAWKCSQRTNVYGRGSAGFMGQKWDGGDIAFRPETWAAVMRVMKPGAHLLAFAAPKNSHRMICAIEDAGFEIRDCLQWIFGSGFPKSHDISKAIDRARDDRADILCVTTFVADAADRAGITRQQIDAHMGTSDMGGWWTSRLLHRCQCPRWEQWLQLKAFIGFGDEMDTEVWRLNGRKGNPGEAWDQREVLGRVALGRLAVAPGQGADRSAIGLNITAPATPEAARWQGFGTALKPAYEPICLARKPLSESSIAANVLRWGTGALNIDGCRVEASAADVAAAAVPERSNLKMFVGDGNGRAESRFDMSKGRWPANIIHDGSDEVVGAFPESGSGSGEVRKAKPGAQPFNVGRGWNSHSMTRDGATAPEDYGDRGSAARFFYQARPDSEERPKGRWPANVITDGSDEVVGAFPETTSGALSAGHRQGSGSWGSIGGDVIARDYGNDTGSAARFFYTAKADQADRAGSRHPTVKPLDLIQYLCRLITPPGGTVLDPFSGTGTTGEAAWREGFRAILIEREAEYQQDIARRMEWVLMGPESRARAQVKLDVERGKVTVEALPLFGGEP